MNHYQVLMYSCNPHPLMATTVKHNQVLTYYFKIYPKWTAQGLSVSPYQHQKANLISLWLKSSCRKEKNAGSL